MKKFLLDSSSTFSKNLLKKLYIIQKKYIKASESIPELLYFPLLKHLEKSV